VALRRALLSLIPALFLAFSQAGYAEDLPVAGDNGANAEGEAVAKPRPKPKAVLAPDVLHADKFLTDPKVLRANRALLRNALHVRDEADGLFKIPMGADKVEVGTWVLFVRQVFDRIDILCRGRVDAIQDGELLVKLDINSVMKIPRKGDPAVVMSPPKTFPDEVIPELAKNELEKEPPPDPGDPGHLQADGWTYRGNINTVTNTTANLYKQVPYFTFPYQHYEWYFEFAWRFGIEYEKFQGDYPVFSYYHNKVTTTQQTQEIVLNYRFKRMLRGIFRPTARLISYTDRFTTDNPDEAVISSSYTGTGGGVRAAFEFTSNVWETDSIFPFAIHRIYFDFDLYPHLAATDNGVATRGTDSGGSYALEYRIGGTALAYFHWIPLFKRFVFEAYYGVRTYHVQFKGPTTNDPNSPFPIAQNGTSVEAVKYWTFSFGVRFNDFIGKFLMPR
jgi:hypothetical protein